MRVAWAVVGGLAIGIAAWWWLERKPFEEAREEREAAARAAAADDRLYRWRDGDGRLHVSDAPPPRGQGRGLVQRVDRTPRDGIEVQGD